MFITGMGLAVLGLLGAVFLSSLGEGFWFLLILLGIILIGLARITQRIYKEKRWDQDR